jgi:hypothetical protein
MPIKIALKFVFLSLRAFFSFSFEVESKLNFCRLAGNFSCRLSSWVSLELFSWHFEGNWTGKFGNCRRDEWESFRLLEWAFHWVHCLIVRWKYLTKFDVFFRVRLFWSGFEFIESEVFCILVFEWNLRFSRDFSKPSFKQIKSTNSPDHHLHSP